MLLFDVPYKVYMAYIIDRETNCSPAVAGRVLEKNMRTFNSLFAIAIIFATSSPLACMGVTSLDDQTATSPAPTTTVPKEPVTSIPPVSIKLPPPSGIGTVKPLSINSIELVAACNMELVLVNGATNDPCGTVTAVAAHVNVETGKKTLVPSQFTWSTKNQMVAEQVIVPGKEHEDTQSFVTAVDALTPQAGGSEPTTEVMACTIPPTGSEIKPLCETVTAHAVISLAGPWLFAGPALGSSGAPIQIAQTGREVLIAGDRKGTVKDLTLKFSDTQFEYELVSTSSSNMQGKFWTVGSTADKTDWFAYRAE